MPDKTKDELLQEQNDLQVKEILAVRKEMGELQEKYKLTHEQSASSSSVKVLEEKYEAKMKENDEKLVILEAELKKAKIQNVVEGSKGNKVVDEFMTALRHKGLQSLSADGQPVRNLDLFNVESNQKFFMLPNEIKSLRTDVDTRAGYLNVPDEFIAQILDQNIREITPMRRLCTVKKSASGRVRFPTKTAHGVASRIAQGGTRTKDTTLTYGQEFIPVHMGYAYFDATIEMLDDSSVNLNSELMTEYRDGISELEGTESISGSGIGEFEGILTNADIGSQSSGDANYLTADAFIDMYFEGLKDKYARGASWLMRRATIGQAAKLKDGSGKYQFGMIPDGSLTQFNIMGSPITESPDMPAVAAGAYPVAFGDWKKGYWIVDKTTSYMSITDPFTSKATGEIEFMLSFRSGGQVVLPESIVKMLIGE